MDRLDEFNLQLNVRKCKFAIAELIFLNHHVSSEGFKPSPVKVQAIRDCPWQTVIHDLRQFLGMVNFYHRCIPKLVETLIPLDEYLSGAIKKDKR